MAEPTEIAGKIAGKARALSAAIRGYRGIFRTLMEEHAEVRTIMKHLADSDKPETRKDLFPIFRAEFLSHAIGEEKEVYPVLSGFAELKDMVERGIDEQHDVEAMIDKLSAVDIHAAEWKPTFLKIKSAIEEHVEEEENSIFPRAKELVGDDEANRIKARFLKVKDVELARLRPH